MHDWNLPANVLQEIVVNKKHCFIVNNREWFTVTLRYSETNQHDALYTVARAYPGGVEALARRMGRSAAVFYNKLRPGIDTHHVAFEEVSEIVELCQQAGVKDALSPLHALNMRHGLVAFPMPQVDSLTDDALAQTVCRAMKEFGEVAASVSESLANDGKISDAELEKIEKEFQDAFAAIGEWRARVRSRADQSNDARA